jgi:hypothetical protein
VGGVDSSTAARSVSYLPPICRLLCVYACMKCPPPPTRPSLPPSHTGGLATLESLLHSLDDEEEDGTLPTKEADPGVWGG